MPRKSPKPKESQLAKKLVPVRHIIPHGLPTVLSESAVVQNNEDGFVVSFYDTRAPLLIGDDDERRKAIEEVDHVDSICVARVFVPRSAMPSLVETLQRTFDNWKAAHLNEAVSADDQD